MLKKKIAVAVLSVIPLMALAIVPGALEEPTNVRSWCCTLT